MQNSLNLPSDDDVRRFLPVSRSMPDPRAAAATSLILFSAYNDAELNRARWPDLDRKTGRLLRNRNDENAYEQLTELLVRQLLAIERRSPTGKIFASSPRFPLPLRAVLASVLERAGLAHFTTNDFVRWSQLQPVSVRLAVATAA